MLMESFKRIIPPKLGRFAVGFLDKRVLDKESPFIPLWLSLVYGVHLRKIDKNRYRAEGFGEKLLMPQGAWRVLLEIFHDDPYERVLRIERNDVVIDVGAHVGFFTVKAAREAGKNGLVVAMEPEPNNAALLAENVRLAGLNNVVVLKEAAGARQEKSKLYLIGGTGRAHSLIHQGQDYIEVQVSTLDDIIGRLGLKRVDYVKIDVEGAELEVLRGAENLLAMPNVKLSIAAYHKMPDGSSEFPMVLSYLKSKNLETWTNKMGYIYARTK